MSYAYWSSSISIPDTTSIGTVGTLARRIQDLPWDNDNIQISDDDDDDDLDMDGPVTNTEDMSLELFLAANSLSDFLSVFHRERVDLPALMLLTDYDLIELGLPMGPRRKVLKAVERRKAALQKPGLVMDSLL